MKLFKKISKNKKGIELTMSTVVVMIIILIAMLVIIAIFMKFSGRAGDQTGDIMDGLSADCDGDGIKNLIDSCPCDPGEDVENCQKDVKKCPGTCK